MTRKSLWFEGAERVCLREEELPDPGPGCVLVHSTISAISAGTEMLFYRGLLEEGAEVDAALEGYRGSLRWPLRYGYATVGTVARLGPGAPASLAGRMVFSFVPHASAFTARAEDCLVVPEGVSAEDAAFFASAETAATIVLDTAPLLGERISVFGLGTIGLLVSVLLRRFPLAALTGWDPCQLRRAAAAQDGVDAPDPRDRGLPQGTEDAAVEVSGSAEGFRSAVAACGFAARLVVASWYGTAARSRAMEAFDTSFHRKRLRITTSQVSTIDPHISGRWDKTRRTTTAWEAVRSIRPSRWISHRVPFGKAADAYRLLAEHPEQCLQVVLAHG